jgi:hypothetical protein
MANFTTHIAVGTLVSGALATVTLAADVVAPENLVAVTLAGVLGSVLPDIDLKDSKPSRAMFSGLAVFFSFAALFLTAGKFSVAEMLVIWLGMFVFVRYGVQAIFHRMSYHRGIWHSLLAAIFSALTTAAVYYYVLGRHEGVSWLAAVFMFVGFMTHLILDEIYSVDVMDTRIKASFGTAVKLADFNHPGHSVAMLTCCALVYFATPPTKTFVEGVRSREIWSGVHDRFWPAQRHVWFGVDWKQVAATEPWAIVRRAGFGGPAREPARGAHSVTTGSLPVDPRPQGDAKDALASSGDQPATRGATPTSDNPAK